MPANADFAVVAHFTTPLDPEKLAEGTGTSRSIGKSLYKFTDRQRNRPAYFFAPNSNLLVVGCMPEAQVQTLANSNGVPSERQQALAGDSSSLLWAAIPPGSGNAPLLRFAGAKVESQSHRVQQVRRPEPANDDERRKCRVQPAVAVPRSANDGRCRARAEFDFEQLRQAGVFAALQ